MDGDSHKICCKHLLVSPNQIPRNEVVNCSKSELPQNHVFQKHGPMKWNLIIQGSLPRRASMFQVKITWDIPESFNDPIVLIVNDAGSPTLDATAIPHFTLSSPHTLRGINLDKKIKFVNIQKHPHYNSKTQIYFSQNFTIITDYLKHGPVRSSSFPRIKEDRAINVTQHWNEEKWAQSNAAQEEAAIKKKKFKQSVLFPMDFVWHQTRIELWVADYRNVFLRTYL